MYISYMKAKEKSCIIQLKSHNILGSLLYQSRSHGGTLLEEAPMVLVATNGGGTKGAIGDGGIPLGSEPHTPLTRLWLATRRLYTILSASPFEDGPSSVLPSSAPTSPPSASTGKIRARPTVLHYSKNSRSPRHHLCPIVIVCHHHHCPLDYL